jgi:hypothetical protein
MSSTKDDADVSLKEETSLKPRRYSESREAILQSSIREQARQRIPTTAINRK